MLARENLINYFPRAHPHSLLLFRFLRFLRVDELLPLSPLPSSKYNILNQLANIKADATLLDMVVVPKQQMHLKQFMEGKAFFVANLSKEVNEEDSYVNKVGVHNFRYPVKKSPFFYLCKDYG